MKLHRTFWYPLAFGGALLVTSLPHVASAQSMASDAAQIDPDVRAKHTVHVSPHRVVFTPNARSTTLEFSNNSEAPAEADVEVQFAYPRWQNVDTVLFSSSWRTLKVRDTVVDNPPPGARYAGPWLSGLPTHLSLGPNETRRVTMRINPPAGLADGEYWARVTTIVRTKKPDKAPKAKDAKASFKIPITGQAPPDLRDSVEVFYRKGPMSTGINVELANLAIDTQNRESAMPAFGKNQLWMIFRVRPTGTAHFDGQMRIHAVNEATGRDYPYTPAYAFSLYQEGILRFFATTSFLDPGKYKLIVNFEGTPANSGNAVPVTPTEITLPFEKK